MSYVWDEEIQILDDGTTICLDHPDAKLGNPNFLLGFVGFTWEEEEPTEATP